MPIKLAQASYESFSNTVIEPKQPPYFETPQEI